MPGIIRKIITNTFVYGLAPYVASVANLLILPIITKNLTEVDYGISGTITAYTGALGALNTLGMSVILTNAFFKYPTRYKWIWRQVYGFLSIWNVIYAFIIASLLALIMPEVAIENKFLIIVLNTLPIVFFGPTSTLATLFYTLKKDAKQIGIRTAIFGVLAVTLNLYFISYLKLGYMGWFYTSFIVGILTNLSYWYSLNKTHRIYPIFNFKRNTIKKALKISIPIIPNHYSYYLLDGSERLIMDNLKVPVGDIGEYNMAASFSNYAGGLTNASSNAITPFLYEMLKDKKFRKTRNLLYTWGGVLLCLTFILCLWSRELFQFLIKNDTLRETYPLAIILIMAYNFRPIFIGPYQLMLFNEKTSTIWKFSLYASAISIGLNLLLIPIFGFKIAAVSLYIAFFYWGIALHFDKTYQSIKVENLHPLMWSMIVIISTIIVFFSRDLDLLIKINISMPILIILAVILVKSNKYFGKDQIKELT